MTASIIIICKAIYSQIYQISDTHLFWKTTLITGLFNKKTKKLI